MRFFEQKWSYSDFGKPNGQACDDCGAGCINRCVVCGAPQCCPRCCAEANAPELLDAALPALAAEAGGLAATPNTET